MRFDTAKGSKVGGKARSAISGKYVKPSYAKNNPHITVIERKPGRGGRKK